MKKIKFNKYILIIISAAVVVGLSFGYVLASTSNPQKPIAETAESKTSGLGYGGGFGKNSNNKEEKGMGMGQEVHKGNCLGDDCLLVDELEYPAGELTDEAKLALASALDDEYKAYSTYDAVINTLGSTRPFSMII